SDDPAFLSPGTEVSAKFKGAFCEAKIKKLCKSVKCKVALKEAPFGTIVVEEHLIRGTLEVNQTVDVSHGKHQLKGVIQHIKDCSTYHVGRFILSLCSSFAASLANLVLLDDQPISKKALDAMSNPQRTAVDRANAFNSKGEILALLNFYSFILLAFSFTVSLFIFTFIYY
ncbi:hypothetical protein ANCDUO_09266, partial [Ancylostoma duodenale]